MPTILDPTGVRLDAECGVAASGPNLTLTFESRGGERNVDYARGVAAVLERLRRLRCAIADAALSSTSVAALPWPERRLNLKDIAYPIRLASVVDIDELRRAFGAAQQSTARQPGALGSGNSTRRVDMLLSTPGRPSAQYLESLVLGQAEWEVRAKVWWLHKEHDTYQVAFAGNALERAMLEVGDEVELAIQGARVGGRVSRSETTEQTQTWLGTGRTVWTHRGNTDALRKAGIHPSTDVRAQITTVGDLVAPTADRLELDRRVSKLPKGATKAVGSRRPPQVSIVQTTYLRDPSVVRAVLDSAAGKCDRCHTVAPFRKDDGTPFLEVHHVVMLSEGGPDTADNAVALCPNCHRLLHYAIGRQTERDALYGQVPRLRRP